MKLKILALAVVLVLISSLPATAATKEGDQELSVGFFYTFVDGDQNITLQANIGYFATDAIEVRATAQVTMSDPDGGDTSQAIFLGVDALYHFNTESEVVPYVGAGGLVYWYESGDTDETTFGAKGIVGVKYFLSEKTSINLEYNFVKIFDSTLEDLDKDIIHILMIQFSYYF